MKEAERIEKEKIKYKSLEEIKEKLVQEKNVLGGREGKSRFLDEERRNSNSVLKKA